MSKGRERLPLVTVAMPVFNGGPALANAVQSIADQTYENWELLILDDGSTDGATSFLNRLSDDRVRVITHKKNEGIAVRLNEAIGLARGMYFARMDHDDVADPDRIAKQVEYLNSYPGVDLLGGRCVAMSDDARILGGVPFSGPHTAICQYPWRGFHLAHPTWMGRIEWFRKHLYSNAGPYRCEDQELLLRTYENSRFHALDSFLLAYKVSEKIPHCTLFRTRLSMLRIQLLHFGTRWQLGLASMSILAFLIKVMMDFIRPSVMFSQAKGAPISEHNLKRWERLVEDNRRSSKKLVGPDGDERAIVGSQVHQPSKFESKGTRINEGE